MTTRTSAARTREPPRFELVGVGDGDHHDRADVVDDRQGQQEDLEGRGDPPAQHGHHAERERDVRRHRDPPARARRTTTGDEEVEDRGHHHAAHCGDHGQRRGPSVAELAGHPLPLDLEPDHQEEQGHQPVVDPVGQVVAQGERADLEAISVPNSERYPALQGEFAHSSATTVATSSTMPPAASTWRNCWTGRASSGPAGCRSPRRCSGGHAGCRRRSWWLRGRVGDTPTRLPGTPPPTASRRGIGSDYRDEGSRPV